MIDPRTLDPRGGERLPNGRVLVVAADPKGPLRSGWLWAVWTDPHGLGPACLLHYRWAATERRARNEASWWVDPERAVG